jgi:hypothetical protein
LHTIQVASWWIAAAVTAAVVVVAVAAAVAGIVAAAAASAAAAAAAAAAAVAVAVAAAVAAAAVLVTEDSKRQTEGRNWAGAGSEKMRSKNQQYRFEITGEWPPSSWCPQVKFMNNKIRE